ncbi:MAG TPA: ATP-binding cassette domain-containing protein, partial [Steroidobacteraceae bacterium]
MDLPRRGSAGARFVAAELQHVQLTLAGRPVLRDICWHIRPGQRWVLMGPNGAGKTLLLKLLAGDVWPSPDGGGTRRYRLGERWFNDPYGVKQELAYLGAERQDRYEHYEWNYRTELIVGTGLHRTDIPLAPLRSEERDRIVRLLAQLGIQSLARRPFLTLSYGERRLVLLARALAWRPKLLLLDEPFTGLDEENRARIAHGLRRLSRSALPWVLSTHRPEDVPVTATHLCHLDGGRVIAQGRIPSRRRLAARHSARRETIEHGLSGVNHARMPGARPGRHTSADAPVLLALRRASVWRDGAAVLRDVSLEVRRGECWLVHGPNGSGKSSFLQLIHGDLGAARGGAIVRAGLQPGVPLRAFQRRVGLIAPELQAICPRHLPALDVVASGLQGSFGLNTSVSADERRRALRALRRVGAAALAGRTLRTLSYGQNRRVLFARALVREPDILLLDEPYAGLDARTRVALRSLVERAI